MTQIFISYAHKDLRKVNVFLERLKPVLNALDSYVTVWMDQAITAGSIWGQEIEDAIDQSDIFLLFVTDRAIGSDYMCKTEWPKIQFAGKRRDALVIPIILEDGSWKDHFSDSQCIPHTSADRQLKPISSWKPQSDGHLAAARACKEAILKYLARPPKAPKDLPGPAMEATSQGLTLKAVPGRAAELRDPDQLSLHDEIRKLVRELLAALTPQGGRNVGSPRLKRALDAYAHEVDQDIKSVDPARVWSAGVDLGIAIDRLLTSEDQELGEDAIEDLERLLRRAETFSMGFEAGRKLQSRARLHRDLSPDRKATLQGSTEEILSGMRAEPGLLTKETDAYFGNVLDAMQDAYGDPNPEALASALEPAVRTGIEALVAVGKAAPREPAANVPTNAKRKRAAKKELSTPQAVMAQDLANVVSAARKFMSEKTRAVEQFAGTQSEIRRFALGIMERFGIGHFGIKVPKGTLASAAGELKPLSEVFDYEAEARKLILAGKAPPMEWVPKVHELNFEGEKSLVDLAPLSGLTELKRLNIRGTGVRELGPIRSLTALNSLKITGTKVVDFSPISHLVRLSELMAGVTKIADLSPLSDLSGLRRLYLGVTDVVDVSPLANLNNLEILDLSETAVSDLVPLSSLNSLAALDISHAPVADLSPLRELPSLLFLGLAGRGALDLPLILPPSCQQLVLLGRPWPPSIALADAKYRIAPDGDVQDPDGQAVGWFDYWADEAIEFRKTGKLPNER